MFRCLIIEDDPHNARYIAEGLQQLGYETLVRNDGVQALAQAVAQPWDIIILDRMLPDGFDGLDILRTVRSLGHRTPVLILSALSATDERVKGLKLGGDDYLAKPFSFTELAARVEALVRRTQPAERTSELVVGDLKLNLLNRNVERAGRQLSLQPREFRLLAYLMTHAGQMVTRTMLLEGVWDLRFDPQTNVIDVHVSRLRNKIDKDFDLPLLHTVRGAGYMLSADRRP